MMNDQDPFKAIEVGDLAGLKTFLKGGLERLEVRDDKGRGLLVLAIQQQNVEIVRFLLESGIKLNSRDKFIRTPLMAAAKRLDKALYPLIEAMIRAGADVNAVDQFGRTALHYACFNDNKAFVDLLVKLDKAGTIKLNYYVPDQNDLTAAEIARARGSAKLLKLLALGRFSPPLDGKKMSLAVVGVGPAGAALFINLVARLRAYRGLDYRKVEILLIDRNRILGAGTPYSSELNSPTSLLNITAAGMSILAAHPADFVDWLGYYEGVGLRKAKVKREEGKGEKRDSEDGSEPQTLAEVLGLAYGYGLVQPKADPRGYYPRLVFGRYVHERLLQAIMVAESMGIRVVPLPECEVVREHAPGTSGNSSKTDLMLEVRPVSGGTSKLLPCSNIYYATGHWKEKPGSKAAYENNPNYIPFPASVKTLVSRGIFDKPSHIAILGSSLSAIDAIYSLLLNPAIGSLTWVDGQAVYQPVQSGWKVTAYSRRGLLPRVRPRYNRALELKYLNPRTFAAIRRKCGGHVPLELVIDLLNREFSAVFGRPFDVMKESDPLQFSSFKDPFEFVHRDLQMARAGDGKTGPNPYCRWYQIMNALFPVIRTIYRQFTPKERATFDRDINSRFLWAFAPMPDSSAEILLAMRKAGVLDVCRVGPLISKEPSGFRIAYLDHAGQERTADHDFLIGTTGLANKFYNDVSDLSQNLISDRRVLLHEPVLTEREGSIFVTDDNQYEILDGEGRHSPERRGIGFFLHAQLFDVQAVPSVVNYGDRVARIYAEEIAYSQRGDEIYHFVSEKFHGLDLPEGMLRANL